VKDTLWPQKKKNEGCRIISDFNYQGMISYLNFFMLLWKRKWNMLTQISNSSLVNHGRFESTRKKQLTLKWGRAPVAKTCFHMQQGSLLIWAVLCRFWELSRFAARLQAGSAKKIGDFMLMCKSYWLQNVENTTDFNLQVKCLTQDVYLVIKMFQ